MILSSQSPRSSLPSQHGPSACCILTVLFGKLAGWSFCLLYPDCTFEEVSRMSYKGCQRLVCVANELSGLGFLKQHSEMLTVFVFWVRLATSWLTLRGQAENRVEWFLWNLSWASAFEVACDSPPLFVFLHCWGQLRYRIQAKHMHQRVFLNFLTLRKAF